jgi:polysaccharide biosynthesis transport protein
LSEIAPPSPPAARSQLAPLPELPPLRLAPETGGAGEGVPLGEYLASLRRYVWLILAAALLSVGFTAYRIADEPARYTAASAVRLVNARQDLAGTMGTGASDQPLGWYMDPVLSHIQVLRSRAVAQAVVDSLGLRLRPEAGAPFPYATLSWARVSADAVSGDTLHLEFTASAVAARLGPVRAAAPYGEPLEVGPVRLAFEGRPEGVDGARMVVIPERDAVLWVGGSIHAVQREMTNVVDIQFTAGDPLLAQRTANELASSFRRVSMHSAQTQSRRRRVFVEEQLRTTDDMLVAAQRQLSAFRRDVRSISPRETYRITEAGLADLRLRRQALLAERRIYEQLHRELALERGREGAEQIAALAASPEIASNGGIVSLYQQLIRYQNARDSVTTGRWSRAETNPDVVQLDSLVSTYRGRLVRAVQSRGEALRGQIGALDEVVATDTRAISALPDAEAEEMRLAREVETLQKLVDDLRREQQRARIDEAVEVGQVEVVDWALAPGAPVGVRARRRLLFALLLGLMAGAAGALALDRLNTRLVRREDAEAALGVPTIAVIPQLGEPHGPARFRLPRGLRIGRAKPGTRALVTATTRDSAGSQAYRKLRTHLLFARGGVPPRTLMVTSPGASEGKTTVSANVATTFAQQGMRVALVDADLRRPRLHAVFSGPRTPGLTELLQGEASLDETLRPTEVPGLDLIPAGRLVSSISELLGGAAMGRTLRELASRYEIVVIDTPPVLAAADAEIVGAQADAVLMVVRAGSTERHAASYAVQQLRAVGARVLGGVLNDPDDCAAEHGRYGYYHEYYSEGEGAAR